MHCYVYLIQCHVNRRQDYIKIGISYKPENRLAELQVACPMELRLVLTMKYETQKGAADAEARLHDVYDELHVRGEWYESPVRKHIERVMANYRLASKDGHRKYVVKTEQMIKGLQGCGN